MAKRRVAFVNDISILEIDAGQRVATWARSSTCSIAEN
jgi:hypothetical protein